MKTAIDVRSFPRATNFKKTFFYLLVLCLGFITACGEGKSETPLLEETSPTTSIGLYEFDSFEAWARPIDDVIAAGESSFGEDFNRGIDDLSTSDDKLWIGYGDANVNLGGVIPINFRYFTSAESPEIEIGNSSGEEQLEKFRYVDGELWMAGVDSLGSDEQVHFPLIGGNMYTHQSSGWAKHNTVPGGEHVHDVVWWNDAAWSVGSGADNRPEFETGQIHRYLWRSLSRGESWMKINRQPFPIPGNGDTRWVNLLPQDDNLYIFGYEYNWVESEIGVANARFNGWDLVPLNSADSLMNIYASGTLPLTEKLGLIWGVDVGGEERINQVWVSKRGQREELQVLSGRTLIDATLNPKTNELVLLSHSGNTYGEGPSNSELQIHLASIDSPENAELLLSWNSTFNIRCVAFFDGSLFLGTTSGDVLRAKGSLN